MKGFRVLLHKEWQQGLTALLVGVSAVLLWDLFLWWQAGRWQPGLSYGLSLLPVSAALVWAFIAGLVTLGDEWNLGTVPQLLMFPVRAGTVIVAKAAATLLQLVVLLGVTGLGGYLMYLRDGRGIPPFPPGALTYAVVWVLVAAMLAHLMAMTAYLLTRSVSHGAGWVLGAGGVGLGIWLMARLGGVLWPLASRLAPGGKPPELCSFLPDTQRLCILPAAPEPAALLLAGMFLVCWLLLSGYILARWIEV